MKDKEYHSCVEDFTKLIKRYLTEEMEAKKDA